MRHLAGAYRTNEVLIDASESAVIRLSKLADYGIVIVTQLARDSGRQQNATEIAFATGIPLPMAGKILKVLTRSGILVSHRGARGGYGLARGAASVTVADVVEALEGPIALTSCLEGEAGSGDCGIELGCPTRANWQRINDAIRIALAGVTLLEITQTIPSAFLTHEERQAAGRA